MKQGILVAIRAMRNFFCALIFMAVGNAYADGIVLCTFGEKHLTLEITDNQVTQAYGLNPDWGV